MLAITRTLSPLLNLSTFIASTMKMSKLQRARLQFTEANAIIIYNREAAFTNGHEQLIKLITAGKREALREMARRFQKAGVYSSKMSLSDVEISIMKRLYRHEVKVLGSKVPWTTFIATTVSLAFFKKP